MVLLADDADSQFDDVRTLANAERRRRQAHTWVAFWFLKRNLKDLGGGMAAIGVAGLGASRAMTDFAITCEIEQMYEEACRG